MKIYYRIDLSKLPQIGTNELWEKEEDNTLTDYDKQIIVANSIIEGCKHLCSDADGVRIIASDNIEHVIRLANSDCNKYGKESKQAGINLFLSLLSV
jgi:hypothetical protein